VTLAPGLLAPGLLGDRRVVTAGGGPAVRAAREQLEALGAQVDELPPDALADEDGAAAWARDTAPLHALVCDAGGGFGAGGADALRSTMEQTWRAVRAVATGALIEAPAPGRLVLIAPRPGAGPHAAAARAALENLARTLAVEWARYQITAVALWPGDASTDTEVAELVYFLISPAGGYFSGCRLELGAVATPAR
jgi:NAD(P)-dependent dehydrogenase (short-subunit alcohol dehydrogenase family)